MAKGFKRIYQPGGLIDYLLIAVPYLLNLPINLLLVSLMPKYPWADVRLVIVFHLVVLAIGFWRRSILVTLYWLAHLAIQLIFVLWYVKGDYGPIQTALWSNVLAGLIFLFVRMVWQNLRNLLIVFYALLPFSMGMLSLALRIIPQGRYNLGLFGSLDLFLLQFSTYYAGIIYYTELIALIPFFMVKYRDLRWAALAIQGLCFGLYREWLDHYVINASLVYYLWIILPVTAIILGWWLDRSKFVKILCYGRVTYP